MEFTYKTIAVHQKPDADPFYLLSAQAEDLLVWADVPRTKAGFMAGYQRELGDRHGEITEFLEEAPANIIPGAIIVALQPETYELGEEVDGVVDLTITVQDPEDIQSLAAHVLESFEARLNDDELAAIGPEEGEEDVDLDEEEEGDVSVAPDSYVAAITRELKIAVEDFDSLQEDKRDAMKEYLFGVSRPGLILDGQHRVFGAKNVNQYDVSLPVVVMPGLPISEQVFHFYVLNNKARPLKPVELRRTISTALTLGEIEDLYVRFKQAKLDANEARWTHLVDTRIESPYAGLVDRGLEGGSGFIPENVMDQVVRAFMKMPPRFKALHAGIDEWSDDDYKMGLFFAFWDEVRKAYPNAWNDAVAKRGGQIFQKVALLGLQEYVLDQLKTTLPMFKSLGQPSPLSSQDALRSAINTYLGQLPEEFFTRDWQRKGLDTGEGRAKFREEIAEVISKGGKNLGNRWLFKASVG